MRSFTHGNPFVLVVITFLLFFLMAYTGVAQEMVEAAEGVEREVDAFTSSSEFSIVTPFEGDGVSNSLLVIIVPASPHAVTEAEVAFLSADPTDEKVARTVLPLSASNHWTASFDTTRIPNGALTATIRVCAARDCAEQSVKLDVENKSNGSSSSENGGRTASSNGRSQPVPPEKPASDESPKQPVFFTPANVAGAFELFDWPGQTPLAKSSGGPIERVPGEYGARFTFLEGMIPFISVNHFSLVKDSVGIVFFENAVTRRFSLGRKSFQPIRSVGINIGVAHEGARIEVGPMEEHSVLIWCRNWNRNESTCGEGEELTLSREMANIQTKDTHLVLIEATPLGLSHPGAGDLVSITPANTGGHFAFIDAVNNAFTSAGEALSLPAGLYRVDMEVAHPAVSLVRIEKAALEHSGTVLAVQSISTSPRNVLISTIHVDYPFESGYFTVGADYNSARLALCSQWDSVVQSCVGEWIPTSPALNRGLSAYQFFPNTGGEGDSSETPVIPPSDRAHLRELIERLKKLYENRRYFVSELDQSPSPVLSSLFNEMELSLECAPLPPVVHPASTTRMDGALEETPEATPSDRTQSGVPLPTLENETDVLPAVKGIAPAENPFESTWEETFPGRNKGRQREGILSCDGVSLQNHFLDVSDGANDVRTTYLGETHPFVKQTLTLTNTTPYPVTRTVNARFVFSHPKLSTDQRSIEPFSSYQLILTRARVDASDANSGEAAPPTASVLENHKVEFRTAEEQLKGSYDWADYWYAGLSPAGMVHRTRNRSVIDTLLTVTLLPHETRVIDPIFDLADTPSFDAAWDGNHSSDRIGNTLDLNGVIILDVDNNGAPNDMIVVAPLADTNGKTDNGVVYVIKDFNQGSGWKGLASLDNFSSAFAGPFSADNIGKGTAIASAGTPGVQILNTDGNAYANDLLITASTADANAKANNGAIWLIKDVDKKSGFFSLLDATSFDVTFSGSTANDSIGSSNGGPAVRVANLDGNVAANDLLIGGSAILSGKAANGSVYMILDINTLSGRKDLNIAANFNARFDGNAFVATESLGSCASSGACMQVLNLDGNAQANDLVIVSSLADYNGKADAGGVYFIKDIHKHTGILPFSNTANFDLRITGGGTSTQLGTTNGWGSAIQFFDTNGTGTLNDVILTAYLNDTNTKVNNGAIWFIADINSKSGVIDLNTNLPTNYNARYTGGASNDQIGAASVAYTLGNNPGEVVKLVNLDGNLAANDLLIAADAVDLNGIANAGAVYLIRDINAKPGTFDLNNTNSINASWLGATASDFLTYTDSQNSGLQLVNIDNNLYANDLLIGANLADINAKANSGVVYLIRDINSIDTNARRYLGQTAHFSARYNAGASDLLTDNNLSGPSVQVLNADGNGYANDLLITAGSADVNGKTDNGAVYLVLDIDKNPGLWDFNSIAPGKFKARFIGANNFDQVGDANRSGASVQIVNVNGTASTNDLLITSPKMDTHKKNAGTVTLFLDVNTFDANVGLDNNAAFFHQWRGDINHDALGDANATNIGVRLVNTDQNALANDLIILSPGKDANIFGDNGAVFLIKDISHARAQVGSLAFQFNLPGYDGNSIRLGERMDISAHVTCILADCGDVTTKLQYCYGYNCLHFSDMNTVDGSFMEILTADSTQSNLNVTRGSGFDFNMTVTGNDVNVFMVRILATGTTAVPSVPAFDRRVVVSPTNTSDLQHTSAFSVKFYGLPGDSIGKTDASGLGAKVVNVDNGSYANDLIISAPFADANGKVDNGAIYLLKNIDQNTGLVDLNHLTQSYSVRWTGGIASDFLGDSNGSGEGFILGDMDGNGYANDLLISAPFADANSKVNNGSIYLVRDIDKKNGTYDFNIVANYSARFSGGTASDFVGSVLGGGRGMILANVDGNAVTNDLILGATFADANSKADAGVVYLLRDFNRFVGSTDLSGSGNYSAAWSGGVLREWLGANTISIPTYTDAIQLVNADGNAYANDLLITAVAADMNAKADVGKVYFIKDINTVSGARDLNNSDFFHAAWYGGVASDRLGYTGTNGVGVQLFNLDGNAYSNDLLISASLANNRKADGGAVYLMKDIDKLPAKQFYDLNNINNSSARWIGNNTTDSVGNTSNSGPAVQIVNMDGNVAANDLVLNVPLEDFNNGTNTGAVYVVLDINARTGVQDLNIATSWNAKWYGVTTNLFGDVENITATNPDINTLGVQVLNIDNGAYSNDLLIGDALYDFNAKTNPGGVFLIKDANTFSGQKLISVASNYSAGWSGGAASDFLGDSNKSGKGFQVANIDGGAYANDLVLLTTYADINTKVDNGGVYLIRDIDSVSGQKDLASPVNFNVRWSGQDSSNFLGDTLNGGFGAQLVDVDGNTYANDLFITGARIDTGFTTNSGAVYLVREIANESGLSDFRTYSTFDWRWRASTEDAALGQTLASGPGVQIINIDNGDTANDLLLTSIFADVNNRLNSGFVALVENVVSSSSLDYTFALLLPSSGCTMGKGNITGGSACQKGYFEATELDGVTDQNQLAPEGQDSGTPFFVYDNQSTSGSDLNILLDLNESLPAEIQLKVSQIFAGWNGSCTGNTDTNCLLVSTTATSIGKATYSTGTQDLNLFIWSDFLAASVAQYDRNVDSNSIAST